MNITPENITELKPNQIFAFGSNLASRHGAGAARFAYENFGARYGVGVGRSGQSYAIPTKDEHIESLPLTEIAKYVTDYLRYAAAHPELVFLTTQIGCGLAGFSAADIAPLFFAHPIPDNVYLPASFWRERKP